MPQLSLKAPVGSCSKTQGLSEQGSVYAGGRCFMLIVTGRKISYPGTVKHKISAVY